MRPLELTIQGFRSYRDQADFSFEGRGLFGVVGPTGSGKSSILDAMVYALYGKTPRVERETRRLINSSSEEAKVRLIFEVDDQVWDVTRVVRKKGNAPVVLRKLGDDSIVESGSSAVTDRIEELLGLDFAAFTSSVTLPQGEFDRFLKAAPADRARILKGIFRLERVDALRELAKQRRGEIDGSITVLKSLVANVPENPQLLLGDLGQKVQHLQTKADAIRFAIPREAELLRALHESERFVEEGRQKQEQLSRVIERLPDAQLLEKLSATEEARVREYQRAQKARVKAGGELAVAERAASDAIEKFGGKALQEARDLLRDYLRFVSTITTDGDDKKRIDLAVVAGVEVVAGSAAALERSEEILQSAEDAIAAAHRKHAAHGLRKVLVKGEPCPVCNQVVDRPPQPGRVPALDSAEKVLSKAKDQVTKSRTMHETSKRDLALLQQRQQNLSEQLEGAEKGLADCTARLTASLGKVKDFEVEIHRRSELLEKLNVEVAKGRDSLRLAEKAEIQAKDSLDATVKERHRFTESLIKVCERLGLDAPIFEDDAAVLLGIAKRAADEAAAQLEAIGKSVIQYETKLQSSSQELETLRAGLELGDDESASEALARTTEQIGAAEADIVSLKESISRHTEAVKEIEELQEQKSRYDLLVGDLIDSKFPAFLLDEHRRFLSELGSDKLFSLTSRYRFDDDGEFKIVDVFAGSVRTADTLSGGETFLASLALALAMAEAVAQQGGRLDCFFLDEGFGSLDAASLELALEGIELLAVPGRLIGLISHVWGIQTRLDDLIVLDRADDGTTVIEQTEGPIGYAPAI